MHISRWDRMVGVSRFVVVVVVLGTMAIGLGQGSADAGESAQPWGAHDPHELDIIEPQDVIVDEAHEQIFFTTFNPKLVVVTDLSGEIVKEIPVPTRETTMTLSPDRSTIWVASIEAAPVYSIDTATLEVTERMSDYCTNAAVEHAEQLISVGPCGIAVRELDDLDTVVHSLTGSEYSVSHPFVRVSNSPDPVLLVIETGSTGYDTFTIDVATWEPVARLDRADTPNRITGIDINPDGSELVIAAPNYPTMRLSLPDLVRGADYPTPGAFDVAYQSDGDLVAVGNGLIRVYPLGASSPSLTLHPLPEMSPHLVTAADDRTAAVVTLFDSEIGFTPWLNMVDVTQPAGSISGTIRHGFPEFNEGLAPMGHVDLFNDVFA